VREANEVVSHFAVQLRGAVVRETRCVKRDTVILPMIAEYSDKTPHPRSPLSLGRGVTKAGEGLVSIEEKHKKCHYNLQPSISAITF
jgi:hypothetical protein